MNRLNEINYLGHSQWRLPNARSTYEFRFSNRLYDSELEVLGENITQLTSGSGASFELLEGEYFVSSDSSALAATLRQRATHFVTSVDNIDFRDSQFAWPVHDGDIGTPLSLDPPCIDTDGDGWGWTGTASCRIGSE